MSDIQNRLARIKNLIVEHDTPVNNSASQRYSKMANTLGGKVINNFAGSYCLIKREYDLSYIHGNRLLSDVAGIKRYPLSIFTVDNETYQIDKKRLCFFDTETTGLGGAGAVPFLIGIGFFNKKGFEINQYIIPDYSDETAMLEDISCKFNETASIVSYNGAAFDLPMLRDRLILNRVANEIKYDKHIDLLHPVRRLFKRRLGDCSLTNVERNIFSFYRDDDIPGYLVPSVYFDWLNEENLKNMEAVMEHNRLDILTLAFLMEYILSIFQNNGKDLVSIDDLHSLAKIHLHRKDHNRSLYINRRIIKHGMDNLDDDILIFNSLIYKKTGDFDKAVPIWEKLKTSASRQGMQANIELAMYLEHKKKDFKEALKYAQKAYKYPHLTSRQKAMHGKRIARLLKKISN